MKAEKIATLSHGQDGAIWGNYLFRFNTDAGCKVYDLEKILPTGGEECLQPVCEFKLDKTELVKPHCNSVVFGRDLYAPGDEFPLLYSNVYNNYAKETDRRKGMCCVYRLQRDGERFYTTLVQVITVAFVEKVGLWCSQEGKDVRPYGNFVIDRERGRYYGFTMIDQPHVTRVFAFRLPGGNEGVMDAQLGVPVVKLTPEDILERFDCPYQCFIQGACCHKGVIYSLEGLPPHPQEHAVALISTRENGQIAKYFFEEQGLTLEPEMIDFRGDVCYYADNAGNLYTLTF